jgi:ABC-type glycerol-3-phosphate transport system substrate-binding protein
MLDQSPSLGGLKNKCITRRHFVLRVAALGATAAAGGGLLAACGAPGSGGPVGQPTSAPAPTAAAPGGAPAAGAPASASGSFTFNSYSSDPTPRRVVGELIRQYEQKSGAKVELNTVAHEDFKQAIRTWLTSDNPPDLLSWFAGNRMRFFINKNQALDISGLWQKEGWDKSYPESFASLSKGTDNKFYFLPSTWYWWAVYFRKPTFQQHNLTPPGTWQEFLQVCETLKKNNITPIAIGAKAPWTLAGWFDYLDMRINGYDFHIGLMEGKERYTDPKVKNVFQVWKDLIDKGYFTRDATAYTWQEQVPALVRGEAGMYLAGNFITDSVPKDAQPEIDFFQFPTIESGVPIAEEAPADGYFIAAKAKNVEAAQAFLSFVGSREGAETYLRAGGNSIPVNPLVDQSLYSETVKRGIDLVKSAKNVAQFYDRDTPPPVAERGMAAFAQFFTEPGADVGPLLEQLDQDAQEIFEQGA